MRNRLHTGSPDHRLDESPAGYSLAGCSPAEPTSASPTIASLSANRQQCSVKSVNGRVPTFDCLTLGVHPMRVHTPVDTHRATVHYLHAPALHRPLWPAPQANVSSEGVRMTAERISNCSLFRQSTGENKNYKTNPGTNKPPAINRLSRLRRRKNDLAEA